MSTKPGGKSSKPKDAAEIEAKVRADPYTAQIAETLKVDLEEYIAGVVKFAMNPELKPTYLGMTNEVMEQQFGLKPMKMDQMLKLFDQEVEVATIADKTDFTDPKGKLVSMPSTKDGTIETEDPKLKEELRKQMLGNKARKG